MENFCNYKTFYIGTPKNLTECPLIYFFQTSKLSTKLSLDKLDILRDDILSQEEIVSCLKKDEKFILEPPTDFEFDLIVYCDSELKKDSNSILGYTVFSTSQKIYTTSNNKIDKLIISITFNQDESSLSEENLIIQNESGILNVKFDFTGNTPKDFYTENNVKLPDETENYLKFTNRIIDFKNSNDLSVITESGLVYKENDEVKYTNVFVKQGINIGVDLYPYYKLGIYENDLVFLKLNQETGEYKLYSLRKTNRFGDLHLYFSGVLDLERLESYEIVGYSQSNLIFFNSNNNQYIIYNLSDKSYTNFYGEYVGGRYYVVFNSRNTKDELKFMKDSEIFSEINKTCILPENKPLSRDNFIFKEKYGSWWILRNVNNNSLLYVSPYGAITSTKSLLPINDRLFLTPDNLLLAVEFGNRYKYPVQNRIKNITAGETLNIKLDQNTTWSNVEKKIECILDGIRRKPIRTKYCFPGYDKIVGSLFGLIFYLDKGILYCY